MAVNIQAVPGTGLVITPDNSGNMTFSTGVGAGNVQLNITSTGQIGIGTNSPIVSLDISQRTDALALPAGASTQRPGQPVNGMMRWNNTIPALEFYTSSGWNIGNSGSVIQTVQKVFADVTTTTSTQTYVVITNGTQSITSKVANSKFLVMYYVEGYMAGASGVNVGLRRTVSGVSARLLGTDGASGDSWLGSGNGAGTNSWTISKQYLDSPGLAAGTTFSYDLLLGLWTAGTAYANYSGYSPQSSITIMEIAP